MFGLSLACEDTSRRASWAFLFSFVFSGQNILSVLEVGLICLYWAVLAFGQLRTSSYCMSYTCASCLCRVVQGQRRKKLNEMQTSQMIRAAAQQPQQRKDYIRDVLVNKAQLDQDPTLKKFGIGIIPRLAEVRTCFWAPGLPKASFSVDSV